MCFDWQEDTTRSSRDDTSPESMMGKRSKNFSFLRSLNPNPRSTRLIFISLSRSPDLLTHILASLRQASVLTEAALHWERGSYSGPPLRSAIETNVQVSGTFTGETISIKLLITSCIKVNELDKLGIKPVEWWCNHSSKIIVHVGCPTREL